MTITIKTTHPDHDHLEKYIKRRDVCREIMGGMDKLLAKIPDDAEFDDLKNIVEIAIEGAMQFGGF